MVDQANIGHVTTLISQRVVYRQALAVFAEDGSIRAFVIQTADDKRPAHQAWIEAEGISYPPQMLDSIKQQIGERLAEIEKELAELGVTGLDSGPPFPLAGRMR